jgi:hypothetical protein
MAASSSAGGYRSHVHRHRLLVSRDRTDLLTESRVGEQQMAPASA